MRSLSTREVLVVIACLFIFSCVFTVADIFTYRARLSDISEQNFQLMSETKADEIDKVLTSLENSVEVIASGVEVSFENVNQLKDRNYLRQYEKNGKNILKTVMNTNSGFYSAYVRFNPDYAAPDSGIFLSRDKNGSLIEQECTDILKYDSSDIEHVGWWYIPVSMQHGVWMDPYRNDNIGGTYLISYILPIYIKGQLLGIVGMDIDYSVLTSYIAEIKAYDSGYAYLRGKNGLIIYHPTLDFNSPYEKPSYLTENSRRLRNQMVFTVTAPKSEVYATGNKITSETILIHLILFVLSSIAIVMATYKLKYNAVVAKKSFADSGNSINIWIVFSIVIFAIIFVQIVFLFSKSGFFKSEREATVIERTDFEQTLNVVADEAFEPYSYYDENGNANGYDIEVVRGIGNQLHKNVNIQLMVWKDAVEAMKNGQADLLLGVENKANANDRFYSRSATTGDDYFIIYGKVPVRGITELKGAKVGHITGESEINLYSLEEISVTFDNFDEIIEAIENDEISYGIVRKSVAEISLEKKGYKDILPVFELRNSRLCIGVKKGDEKLLNQVNAAIENLNNEGTLDRLEEKWLTDRGTKVTTFDVLKKYEIFYAITASVVVLMFIALLWISLRVYYEEKHRNREDALEHLSETDLLTDILNRGAGERKIQELIELKKSGMFCLLDVDKFKSINDTYGHAVGDKVLCEIARCLSNSFRDRDIVMRLGGDEFAAYAVGIGSEQLGSVVINRFFTALRDVYIPEMGERKINVSLGAVFYREGDTASFDELYKSADKLTYKSKLVEGSAMSFN